MRAVLVLVALWCTPAPAGETVAPGRGWLTGAGLVLAAGGAVALTVGAYDCAQAEAARGAVSAYYANGSAPTFAEASLVRWLAERSDSLGSLGLGLLLCGTAAAALGLALVGVDGWLGPAISVAVHPARASVVLSGTF